MDLRMDVEEVPISPDIHEPPYLQAIQWLSGQKPGEKYRHLNAFVQRIVEICRETGVSSADVISTRQQDIPAALMPLVRILTGIELKLTEAVIEGLKSPDILVVNKALRAKWFFDGSNSHVDAPYFKENIFPFVSVRTRMDIVKALTRGLYDAKGKAENFFNLFYDMFDLQQAMPFLPYCNEKFIFATILKFKIVLSCKMLDTIFKRYPNLAIQYLYLGCYDFSLNEADRKIHSINLQTYADFLPKLIKKYVSVYIKFISYVSCNHEKIGSSRRRALFKNAQDFVMDKAQTTYSDWSLKYIYYSLSKPEFEKYYASLHPKNYYEYNFSVMFGYLKYYPKDSRIDFMKNQYEQIYKKEFGNLRVGIDLPKVGTLFESGQINEEQFETLYSYVFPSTRNNFKLDDVILNLKNYSNKKMLNLLRQNMKDYFLPDLLTVYDIENYKSEKYLLLLPVEEKSKNAERLISFSEKGSDSYYKWCCFLPVDISFSIFKFGAESKNAQKRATFLKRMIYSCKIYNDQTHLSKVLKYYIQRHGNEPNSTLNVILAYFLDQFNILDLNDTNWQLYCEIVETAYIKNELFNAPVDLVNKIFEGLMHRLSIQSEEQMEEGESSALIAVIHKYLEFQIVYRDDADWTIFESIPDLENKFIKLFMFYIPIKYPENHEIWREDNKKEKVGLKIISKLHKRNQKIINAHKPQERNENYLSTKITRVTNYTWLKEITEDLLRKPNSKNSVHLESFKCLVEAFDKEFYLSAIPDNVVDDPHKNIVSGKAIWYLKNDRAKILDCWETYFSTARKMMQSNKQKGFKAAKNFIISTKWHQELPIKFIKSCIAEMKKPGSLTILALLVDGESLSNFLSNYIPSEPTVDIQKINAREDYRIISFIPTAMNRSVPFVSTEILMSMFQRDYIKLGQRSVRNFGQRVDKPSVVNFAKQLLDKPVSAKKHGIRLMFSILTNDEIVEFVSEISNYKQHPTINMIIAQCIFHLFITYPNDKTWNLVSNSIDKLSCFDILSFKVFAKANLVCNSYAPLYYKKILSKIDDLSKQSTQMKTELEMKVNDNKRLRLNAKEKSLKEKLTEFIFENTSEESIKFLTKEVILNILRTYYFRGETRMISLNSIKFAEKVFSQPVFIGRQK